MQKLKSKLFIITAIFQLLAVLFTFVSPAMATSLDSANYKVTDFNLNYGGGLSTSTNYSLQSNIELVLDAQITAEEEEEEEPGDPGNPPPPDTTPPEITSVQAVNITTSTAEIIWNTDENADSYVEYGLTPAYGTGFEESALLTTSHAIDLVNLIPETTYHFRVKSKDASNNEAVSADYTFTTLALSVVPPEEDTTPPVISNIRVEDITGTSAAILWDTDEPSTSIVNYGLTQSYEEGEFSEALVTSHRIVLEGLTPDTEYHFQVGSIDASNNSSLSTDNIFRTLDTIPPIISNVRVINITDRTADVTWVTNEATTSQIFYRRVGDLGFLLLEDDVLQVSHFNTLIRLIANTNYEFYIIAEDATGNTATSGMVPFTTLPDNIPPANIRNFVATPDDSLNVLTWQNPIDRDFEGVYIVSNADHYPDRIGDGEIIYIGSGVSFTHRGLTNGTKYYYTGFAYDTSRNFASGAITDGTPFAEEEEEEEEEEIIPPIVPPTINLGAISFYVANRTIQIFPDSSRTIETLINTGLGVSVERSVVGESARMAILRVDDSRYLFRLSPDERVFNTDVVLPQITGVYRGEIILIYDDRQQIIPFNIDTSPNGVVFERLEDRIEEISGAKITLYVLEDNEWNIWPGFTYYQDNPVITLEDGAYGYLVPDGTYYLKAEKPGYRTRTTNRFIVDRNYINQSLELLRIPLPLIEVIKPEAPITENIVAITKNLIEKVVYGSTIAREVIVDVFQNPIVEETNEKYVAPGLVGVAVLNVLSAIPFLNLLTYLQYLFTQPLLFLKRRKRKAWGVVYNAFTKVPLDLAIIRLIEAGTKKIVRTLVTDREGRYILLSPKGKFKMTSTKPEFQFPSAYLKGKKEDESFVDLYFGEHFSVRQDGQAVIYNIPMDPTHKKVSVRKMILDRALKGFQFGLALSGIVLTTVSLIISPSVILAIFLVIHIAMFVLFMRLARPRKFKKWGIVRDAKTKKPLKNVVIRLFEPQYNRLLGTQITNSKGRYAFLVGRNIYYMTFERAGYKAIKTKNIDTRTKAKTGLITEKVKMEKNKK